MNVVPSPNAPASEPQEGPRAVAWTEGSERHLYAVPRLGPLARRHTSCEKLPALLARTNQSHRIEMVGGLLDEQVVFADRAERPQREWFEISARSAKAVGRPARPTTAPPAPRMRRVVPPLPAGRIRAGCARGRFAFETIDLVHFPSQQCEPGPRCGEHHVVAFGRYLLGASLVVTCRPFVSSVGRGEGGHERARAFRAQGVVRFASTAASVRSASSRIRFQPP